MSNSSWIISALLSVTLVLALGRGDARAEAPITKTVQVKGAVRLELEVVRGAIQIKTWTKKEVSVTAACAFELAVDGDRVEVDVEEFGPHGSCRGPYAVTVPAGSRAEIVTVNGDVTLTGSYGDVEVEAVNGSVTIERANDVEVEAVNGRVTVGAASGKVRVETVSGGATVTSTSATPDVRLEAVSGSLAFTGACGKGCRLDAEAHSGNVTLTLAPTSAFSIAFESDAGALDDGLGITKQTEDRSPDGVRVRGSYGKVPAGAINVETYSGKLTLERR